jgi:site-specific DNA-methyltransferase (adenine-specific)
MNQIINTDCLQGLKSLPEKSVNCCVTSPPYFGLRDYGVIGQIGLEQTPQDYVNRLVEVFREVRRVLKDDGTVWLNLGDCFNAYNANRGTKSKYAGSRDLYEPTYPLGFGLMVKDLKQKDLKQKDLIGIPWRVAFALQTDGWYLRSEIIWDKNNPMPESVKNRPTKSHEHIFLLAKSVSYYYDWKSIREPCVGKNKRSGNNSRVFGADRGRPGSRLGASVPWENTDNLRNKRDVWRVSTSSFRKAHFATFPPDLIRPCILAGCPGGG